MMTKTMMTKTMVTKTMMTTTMMMMTNMLLTPFPDYKCQTFAKVEIWSAPSTKNPDNENDDDEYGEKLTFP